MHFLAGFNLVLLLVFSALALGAFAFGLGAIVGRVRAGGPDITRTDRPWLRLATTLGTILSHSTFRRRPFVRAAHWLVMLSFPALFATLITGFGQAVNPQWTLGGFLSSRAWMVFTNFWAWAGVLGIVALTGVRLLSGRGGAETAEQRTGGPSHPPARFRGSNAGQAYFVEAVIFVVCAAVLLLHYGAGARAALSGTGDAADYGWLAPAFTEIIFKPIFSSLNALDTFLMLISALKVAVSMLWLVVVGLTPTMGVAWHRFLAVFNLYFRDDPRGGKPVGYYPPLFLGKGDGRQLTTDLLADPQSLGDSPQLGAVTPRDFSWKSLLDVASCTECGRCQEVCPAWATGKELSPKTLVMTIRDTPLDEPIIGSRFPAQALWQCTNCAACMQACPVDIDHVSLVTQLRRGQVLTAGQLPRDYTKVLRKVQSKGNPWGAAGRARLDWATDLDFEVPVVGRDLPDAASVDYLLWVGAAGSFDPDSRRTTAAVARLLHMAGASFAVLGQGEVPTGELARQLGDEVSFLSQAQAAIEVLRQAQPQAIICTSPHVFNIFTHDYQRLGADFTVLHHTQVLNQLVRQGRLVLSTPRNATGRRPLITFQDPCFLARHGGQVKPARELLSQVGQVVEMPRSAKSGMCCGGGGGGAFVEENQGVRISNARAQEAAATGARFLATACPYCHLMLEAGMSSVETGQRLEVRDVAQLMLEVAQPGKIVDANL